MPELSEALLSSYRNAIYRVAAPAGNVDLKVGVRSSELSALLEKHGARSAAFITACNPRSEPRTSTCNTRANRALRQAITALGLRTLTGVGFDQQGAWPGEESLLVLNISQDAALALGRKFQQHAVIWIGADARPGLLLCGEDADVR